LGLDGVIVERMHDGFVGRVFRIVAADNNLAARCDAAALFQVTMQVSDTRAQPHRLNMANLAWVLAVAT
jgi:hypothetical protein